MPASGAAVVSDEGWFGVVNLDTSLLPLIAGCWMLPAVCGFNLVLYTTILWGGRQMRVKSKWEVLYWRVAIIHCPMGREARFDESGTD